MDRRDDCYILRHTSNLDKSQRELSHSSRWQHPGVVDVMVLQRKLSMADDKESGRMQCITEKILTLSLCYACP